CDAACAGEDAGTTAGEGGHVLLAMQPWDGPCRVDGDVGVDVGGGVVAVRQRHELELAYRVGGDSEVGGAVRDEVDGGRAPVDRHRVAFAVAQRLELEAAPHAGGHGGLEGVAAGV